MELPQNNIKWEFKNFKQIKCWSVLLETISWSGYNLSILREVEMEITFLISS